MLVVDMKKIVLFLLLCFSIGVTAQQITLKKGTIIDKIPVKDSITENFALYLPSSFDITKKWPIIFVFDMEGRGKQVISMFREAAEAQGYILAASNNVRDTITLSKNILISNRMFNTVYSILPIQKDRSYTAGFDGGARMASLIPTFIKEIEGVISCGSPVANEEVLSSKNQFHFIGIVGNVDFNYTSMLNSQLLLNKLKFPNQLIVFEGGEEWPKSNYLNKAMEIFTLAAMAKGIEPKNQYFVDKILKRYERLNHLERNNVVKMPLFSKKDFIKNDYTYFLEEDVVSYNYNNLGWWSYQMDELAKYEKSASIFERQMGKRLVGYVNALIADNLDGIKATTPVDEEALTFLWMINTITDAKNPRPYLKVISNSARVEDFDTSLFYLEELLKRGYTNKKELYSLENTAILRLSPEFNELVAKYLKEARYELVPEDN
ncbi:hypothetical protein GQR58_025060 [Nymphon striatum]|nr:hypothetical protein GQR58_025060 [Nymphon striatum]